MTSEKVLNQSVSDPKPSDRSSGLLKEFPSKENSESVRNRMNQCSNSNTVHPSKPIEDENLDYDSNASSSSFEFHKGERSVHSSISRSHLRPMPSKWNDAEKWIMNRQNKHKGMSRLSTTLYKPRSINNSSYSYTYSETNIIRNRAKLQHN